MKPFLFTAAALLLAAPAQAQPFTATTRPMEWQVPDSCSMSIKTYNAPDFTRGRCSRIEASFSSTTGNIHFVISERSRVVFVTGLTASNGKVEVVGLGLGEPGKEGSTVNAATGDCKFVRKGEYLTDKSPVAYADFVSCKAVVPVTGTGFVGVSAFERLELEDARAMFR